MSFLLEVRGEAAAGGSHPPVAAAHVLDGAAPRRPGRRRRWRRRWHGARGGTASHEIWPARLVARGSRASLPRRYCSRNPSRRANCGLPVASAEQRGGRPGLRRRRRGLRRRLRSIAFSARRSAATWRRVARSAASAAISPSSARRTSRTCTTASIEPSTAGVEIQRRWPAARRRRRPSPGASAAAPRDLSWCTASRTTVRDTPCAAASCCSVGSRSPGLKPPASICAPAARRGGRTAARRPSGRRRRPARRRGGAGQHGDRVIIQICGASRSTGLP